MADRLVCVISWSDRSVRASSGKRGILFTLNFFLYQFSIKLSIILRLLCQYSYWTTTQGWAYNSQRLAPARVPPKKLWNYPHLLILRLTWSRCSVYFIKILFL